MANEDWRGFRMAVASAIRPHDACVFCADWRALTEAQTPDVVDEIERVLASDNRKLKRSGILVEPSPFMLQFSQLVIKAAHPHRRVFYTKDKLGEWLLPELDADERQVMADFISEV